MARHARLTTTDLRGALALVNELHDLGADPLVRRRHLLAGLCGLLDADVGVAITRTTPPDGRPGSRGSVVSVGWDRPADGADADRHFRDDGHADPMVAPTVRAALGNGWSPATLSRSDAYADAAWGAFAHVRTRRERWGLDDCLASLYPLSRRGRGAWVLLYRRSTRRPRFAPRHRDLLHAIHGELDWLYRPAPAPDPPEFRRLTVRQKQTLHRLLAGDSEKQVAAGLGLSRHTIHVHVKSIYKTFAVNTRQELLARFVRPPAR